MGQVKRFVTSIWNTAIIRKIKVYMVLLNFNECIDFN